VDEDVFAFRRSQRDVQHSPVLRDVDLLAREHGVDARPESRPFRQGDEEPERLVGDAVLGVVEVQSVDLDGHHLAPFGVLGAELGGVGVLDLVVVLLECPPLGRRGDGGHHPPSIPALRASRARPNSSVTSWWSSWPWSSSTPWSWSWLSWWSWF